jgi:putative ABC transport system ATP-binding protein
VTDPAPALLELTGLTKRYRPERPPVLENIELVLRRGEYVAIMGESGVGKSTLLNLLAGLERPDSGHIRFEGREVGALDDDAATFLRREKMGFVFQAFHVLPFLNVGRNVALPLDLLAIPAAERAARTGEMLAAVGLAGYAQRYPRELSGGELQRVAIARALIHRPQLVLADEPTGNLDPRTAQVVLTLLREQISANGGSGILITHSRAAADTADRVLVLDGRRLTMLDRA